MDRLAQRPGGWVAGLLLTIASCGEAPGTAGSPRDVRAPETPPDAGGAAPATSMDERLRPEDTEVWEPEPAVVMPGGGGAPPSDAISLFDGGDLSAWVGEAGTPAAWTVDDAVVTVAAGTGAIRTRRRFGDVQLHLEWRAPRELEGEGQGRGNSGVFFMERYELQVLDSYENRTYSNGQAGSIYKQHAPLVNASRPPGDWQRYDVVFRAPRFESDGSLSSAATMTVFHNGVLIHDHAELGGATAFIGLPEYEAHAPRLPIMLQDHGNPVSYRNIWVRELAPDR